MFKKIALAAVLVAAFSSTATAGDLRLGTTSNGGGVIHYGISKIGMGGLYLQLASVDREDTDLPAYTDQSLAVGWAMGWGCCNTFYWNGNTRNRVMARGSLMFTKLEAINAEEQDRLDMILEEDNDLTDLGLTLGFDVWMKRFVVGADVAYNGLETSGRVTVGVGF